jgi:hypothetical protein
MGERWECRRRYDGVVAVVVVGQGLAPKMRVSWVFEVWRRGAVKKRRAMENVRGERMLF